MHGLKKICCLCVGLFFISGFSSKAEETAQQIYIGVFLECSDGQKLEKEKDYVGALVHAKVALLILQKLQVKYPDWQQALLAKKMNELKEKVIELGPLAAEQISKANRTTFSSGPPLFMLFDEGSRLEKANDYRGAMNQFEKYSTTLEIIHDQDPNWEEPLIETKIRESEAKVYGLESLVLKQFGGRQPSNGGVTQ
jgi:hypothetical protein